MDLYNRLELGDIRNVSEEEQEKFFYEPIYQILPLKYLKSILINEELRFNNVFQSWEDPYELFIFKQKTFLEGKSFSIDNYEKRTYGQCWSLNKDTDAMWRIYSPDRNGVRIKTTIGKMIRVLDKTREMMWTAPIFGRVKYVEQSDINTYLRDIEKGGSGKYFESISDSLFYKRTEFSHENEVRFIINVDPNQPHIKKGYINLKVNPSDFIEEIGLDPRLDTNEVNEIKEDLLTINNSINITQSDLYAFEPLEIYLDRTPIHIVNALDKYKERHNISKGE